MDGRININRQAPPPAPNYWNGPMPAPKPPGMTLRSLRTTTDAEEGKKAAASIPVLTKEDAAKALPLIEARRPFTPDKPRPAFVAKTRPPFTRNLSRRQQGILDYIKHNIATLGFPPTIREIGEEVGLSSSSTVFAHLVTLEAKGYIKRDASKPRHITVLDFVASSNPVLVGEGARLRAIFEQLRADINAADDPATSTASVLDTYAKMSALTQAAIAEAIGPDPDDEVGV